MDIQIASTEEEIRACFPAFYELRPHLEEEFFVAQVQRQMKNHGYVLIYISQEEKVLAAAGYRVAEFLAWGQTFYVDDLITRAIARQHGYGGTLLDWMIAKAQELGCNEFHLDSGVQRFDAHRLYMSRKMLITSHHFAKKL